MVLFLYAEGLHFWIAVLCHFLEKDTLMLYPEAEGISSKGGNFNFFGGRRISVYRGVGDNQWEYCGQRGRYIIHCSLLFLTL